tara:strand:- start:1470 stop:1868 length:399 start_codon:yes stop_codon:yes gene_type:complete
MRFYIASRLADELYAKEIASVLKGRGHEQTYDWTAHGSMQHSPDKWADTAAAELAGVAAADVVVVVTPGGRGTHVELGAALALGKKVLIWIPFGRSPDDGYGYSCVFHHHPNVATVLAGGIDDVVNHPVWEK